MQRPLPDEFAPFYANYIALVQQTDGLLALKESSQTMLQTLRSIPATDGTYRYAPGKWSINEVLQHIIDTELIFLYRALRIARNDKTPLPGFEQDDYVPTALSDYQSTDALVQLFATTRQLSLGYFATFPPHTQTNMGTASNAPVSVRALCYMICGHGLHHLHILKTRYL